MRTLKNYLLTAISFICVVTNINAQESTELHPKTESFSNEVFLNCNQYITAEKLVIYSWQINKTEVIEGDNSQLSYPLLSSIDKKNKCNANLSYNPESFDPENFNPLKYQFNFYSEEDQFFSVDNTSYIIHIAGN